MTCPDIDVTRVHVLLCQVQERERIRREEQEYVRQKYVVLSSGETEPDTAVLMIESY